MDAVNRHAWNPQRVAGHVEHGLDVEAELDALDAGVGLGVRLRRQVGVDPQRHRGDLAHFGRDAPEREQFFLALDVEQHDVVFESAAHFGVGLADAGEDDLGVGSAGGDRAVQLAAAGHVEPRAVLGHQPANREVAVGLDRVGDDRLGGGKSVLNLAQFRGQRALGVDVERRAEPLGEVADR